MENNPYDEIMIRTNQTFEYKGHKVLYHHSGKGSPMILLHNGGCSHIIWKHQIEYFTGTHHVMALDLLGFGDSGRPKIPYTLDLYVDLLSNFIEENEIIRPILVGNCIGAAIALEYANQYPDKAASLALCNICGGVSMMRYVHPFMFPLKRPVYSEKQYRWMFAFGQLDYVQKKVIERLYGNPPNEKDEVYQRLRKGLKHPLQPQSRIMLMLGLDSYSKFDHYEEVDSAELPPTIVFWGKKNRVLPVKRGEWFIRQLQPEAHKIYSDQGHLLMAEAPSEFNRDLEAFLQSLNENSETVS